MASSDLQLYSRSVPAAQMHLAKAVRDMALSTDESNRALALNLICDHRISAARADHFFRFVTSRFGSVLSPQYVIDGLREYRKLFVATQPDQTYDEGSPLSINYVDCVDDLVHVCNVSSKLVRITNYSARSLAVREALKRLRLGTRALTDAAAVNAVLAPKFASASGMLSFVDGFLDLLNVYRLEVPWNPIWAADWPLFQSTAQKNLPGYWLESVGVPCSTDSEWIMLFRYPASQVPRLYRPTQLEAGAFAYHFPSPPSAPCKVGGHPMSMEPAPIVSTALLSEFIHSEISFSFEHWRNAGSRLAATPSATKYDLLMSYRSRHHSLLEAKYTPQVVAEWMPDATRMDI